MCYWHIIIILCVAFFKTKMDHYISYRARDSDTPSSLEIPGEIAEGEANTIYICCATPAVGHWAEKQPIRGPQVLSMGGEMKNEKL